MAEEKTKKPIYKRWWFILVAVIIVMGVIFGGGEESTPTGSTSNGQAQPASSTPAEPATPTPKETEKTITKIGEPLTTKNFKVTVEALNKLKGSSFNQPKDGHEFVEVVLLIENISDKEYNVSSLLMFKAYCDDFSVNESLEAQIANDKIPTVDGALGAGKKLRGKLAYELPKEWKELEIDVDLTAVSFSNDGKIKIILQNQ
jgi:hypothetical protein